MASSSSIFPLKRPFEAAFGPGTRVVQYDVFINHRGIDVKDTLASHIYDLLDIRGIRAFLDREELEAGEDFSDAITEAIQSSSVQIAIFSEHYAESSWCLKELALMLKTKARIIPVFYNVKPEDVRWVKGTFETGFEKHRKRYPPETLNEWRTALKEVSGISGLSLSELKGRLARTVVDEVLKQINKIDNGLLTVPDFVVGLQEHVANLRDYISACRTSEKGDPTFVLIFGTGGVGKSTLAKSLFNEIRSNFDKVSYVEDVRGEVEKNGVKEVQLKLIRDLLCTDDYQVSSSSQGKRLLRRRLSGFDVLIVLDNIQDNDQMDAILAADDLLPTSTVIVTSRDNNIFKSWNKRLHYELRGLNLGQSKELLCWHAFRMDHLPADAAPLEGLVDKFVCMSKGLPLALEICGQQLSGRCYSGWMNYWNKLSQIMLPDKLKKILRVSYDELDEKQKEIFLDIAVFFHGEDEQTVRRIWEEESGYSSYDLEILAQKCMIKLDSNRVIMHDLLRKLGRAIVDEESPQNPGRRSRLWRPSDVKKVLRNFKGTENVRGISLVSGGCAVLNEDKFGNPCAWPTDSFANMTELQLLELKDDCLQGDFGKLPQQLLWLRWLDFPFECIPPNFQMDQIRVLSLCRGKCAALWNEDSQNPWSLQELNLQSCYRLQRVPDSIGRLRALQKLDFSECVLVATLPEEFCNLEELMHLNLIGCKKLEFLPSRFGELRRLQRLDSTMCSELKTLPDSFGQLPQIQYLHIGGCSNLEIGKDSFRNISTLREVTLLNCKKLEMLPIQLSTQRSIEAIRIGRMRLLYDHFGFKELPADIGELSELRDLDLNGLNELREIPQSIGNLSNLNNLTLLKCPGLEGLPMSIGRLCNLESLYMSNCPKLESLPTSIGDLSNLEVLRLIDCPSLKELPASIGNLSNLREIDISDCPKLEGLPKSFASLSSLEELSLTHCPRVEELALNNLNNLKHVDLTGCRHLRSIFGHLDSLEVLSTNGCWKLQRLDVLHRQKHLVEVNIHLSDDLLQSNYQWVEGLISVPHIHLSARAIPYPTTRLDDILGSSYKTMTNTGGDLEFQAPISTKGCSGLVICFVSVVHVDKFYEHFLPPPLQLKFNGHYSSQSKYRELIHLKIHSKDDYSYPKCTSNGNVWTTKLTSMRAEYLKQGWVQMIGEGEEYRIQHICTAFLEELRRQHLPSLARCHSPSQLSLRNVQALDIANCRIRRLCQLYNTPIQEEDMELCWRKKQRIWEDDKELEYLDLSVMNSRSMSFLSDLMKSMANFYRMEVIISSRGTLPYTDELQEYDEDAVADHDDPIPYEVLNSRKLLKCVLKKLKKNMREE